MTYLRFRRHGPVMPFPLVKSDGDVYQNIALVELDAPYPLIWNGHDHRTTE